MRPQCATTTITRAVTGAAGVFAPGHLGELTQYLPFELVDDVLEQTRTVQRRLRELPSRVGVYFVLALGMYPRLGYARVWAKLTAGLAGLDLPDPSEKALRDLRRRLGPAPLKALFEVVAGPLAQPHTPGARFGGLRTVAFDGLNSVKVPDTGRNRSWIGKIRYRQGLAGYPVLRLMALAETGTRALLGAAIGCKASRDEAGLARQLLPLLGPGMLVLLDRAFDASAFLAEVAATGAMLLARGTSTRCPPVLEHLPDGSYLSDLDGLPVRIIEADLAVTGSDGSRIQDSYRLITTLTDDRRYPAAALVRLFDAVMLSKHVVLGPDAGAAGLMGNPRDWAYPGNQDPSTPWPSSLILLGAVASVTTRLRLIAGAVIPPLRHPLLLAKELATVDQLSRGRLIVIPTVSWSRDEYAALGVPFGQRGSLLDEHLAAWEQVYAHTPASFDGVHYRFRDVYLEPKAYRPGGPLLWFGGQRLRPALLRRLIRYGHGFNPLGRPQAGELQALRTAMAAANRDPDEMEMVGGIRGHFPSSDAVANLGQAMESLPEQWEQGFTTICVKPSMFINDPRDLPKFCREALRQAASLIG